MFTCGNQRRKIGHLARNSAAGRICSLNGPILLIFDGFCLSFRRQSEIFLQHVFTVGITSLWLFAERSCVPAATQAHSGGLRTGDEPCWI